jgi:hypothetical protein
MFIYYFIFSFHFTFCHFISKGYSFCEMMEPASEIALAMSSV